MSYSILEKKKIGNHKSPNLLINSDNLIALEYLKKSFNNKIKLIYIDPPYNTGKNFDHFDDKFEHNEWLDQITKRIEIMRDLLSEHGSLWISIDDDEAHYLKIRCDQIFDRKNFVATIIWQKKAIPCNDSKYISDNHDYIFVYAKNKIKWKPNLLPRTNAANARYKNPDNDKRGIWTSSDLTVKTPSTKYRYKIITPNGRVVVPPLNRSWSMPQEKFKKLINQNRIWFGKSGNNIPRLKRFLSDVRDGIVPQTIWLRNEVGDNQEAKKEVIKHNPKSIFATPKPERLMERILHIGSNKKDWVLDPYAGSGTTGATAAKMKRNWILIEVNGVCKSHCLPRLINTLHLKRNSSSLKIKNKTSGFTFFKLK